MWELLWLEEDEPDKCVPRETTSEAKEMVVAKKGPHGLTDSPTIPFICYLANNLVTDFVFLSETKCSVCSLESKFARLGFVKCNGSDNINNKGGMVLDDKDNETFVTFMYGSPYLREREEVWSNVSLILNVYSGSHLIIGDLNQLENSKQKLGGRQKIPLGCWFKNWTIKHDLSEITFKGDPFTWTNNREGENLVLERLDRAYGNNDWKHRYPEAIVWNFPIFLSDHGPIALDTNPRKVNRKRP
ncbi:Exocyst complex component SEC8 [Bienertia sinuspersici]